MMGIFLNRLSLCIRQPCGDTKILMKLKALSKGRYCQMNKYQACKYVGSTGMPKCVHVKEHSIQMWVYMDMNVYTYIFINHVLLEFSDRI